MNNIKTFIVLSALFLIQTLSSGQNKVERNNVASAIYGSRAEVILANGQKVSADKVINGNYDDASAIKLEGVPATLQVEFPIPVQINLIRIFPGMTIYAPNPSGDCGIKDYHVEGYNNGYWHPLVKAENQPDYLNSKAEGNATYFYEHNFRPTTVSAIRIVVTRSGHTGRSASNSNIVPEEKRTSFIREFEVYEAGKNSAFGKAFYFNTIVSGDFRLPVYRQQSQAGLTLKVPDNIPSFPAIITVVPEQGGSTIEEREISIVPGIQTVLFDLSSYSDGRYIVNLAPKDKNGIYKGDIKRMLRVDRGGFAAHPTEPIQVLGQKVFPVDDFHFVEREGVESFVKPADQVIQASKPLAPDRPIQNAIGSAVLNYDSQGNFVMYFNDANRMGGDKKYHYAYSKDLSTWQIADESPTGVPNKLIAPPYKALPSSAVPRWSEKTKLSEASVVFYDKARDGVPPLNEIRIQWFPPTLCDATQYGLIKWGTYPVWEKRKGEWLVLTRDPLIVDKFEFDSDELETESSSNDNFGPQYLSDDGKTLYFSRAAKLRRFAPYTIEYDNITQAHRIMRTHYSQDGINWQVRYLALPEESDHWSYQHYGVHTFRVDKDYYIGYLHAYHCTKQQIYTELIYSRDGLNWNRLPNSKAFIPNGPMGSWTSGMIFTQSNPVELNGKYYLPLGHVFKSLHFYITRGREDISFVNAEYLRRGFSGRNLVEQWPYFDEIGGWEGLSEDMHNDHASVGLAVFRKDGWISSRASSVGSMLSRVFTAPNAGLNLNADTGIGGEIRIEVLNADGTPIESYCGANAALYKGDGTDAMIKWSKGTMSVLPEVPFRLRISMEKAEIYALEFVETKRK